MRSSLFIFSSAFIFLNMACTSTFSSCFTTFEACYDAHEKALNKRHDLTLCAACTQLCQEAGTACSLENNIPVANKMDLWVVWCSNVCGE